MKTALLILAVGLSASACSGASEPDRNHPTVVQCARVECDGEASSAAFFVLNSDTAGTPHRVDYLACTWPDGVVLQFASADDACFVQSN